MIEVKINFPDDLLTRLERLAQHSQHRAGLMRKLAGTMQAAVDKNFEQGGRPQWLGVKHRSGIPLNDNGNLRASIQAVSNSEEAVVGTNLIYAPIHQFGGTIKPKKGNYLKFQVGDKFVQVKEVKIPARPFLTLTAEDEADLVEDAQSYFASLIK